MLTMICLGSLLIKVRSSGQDLGEAEKAFARATNPVKDNRLMLNSILSVQTLH